MSASDAPAARRVPCPRCKSPAPFEASNRWRPFCSARCAGIDLGAWASEAYRVASSPGQAETGEAVDDTPQH